MTRVASGTTAALLLTMLSVLGGIALAQDGSGGTTFTEPETRHVLAHGPWPQAWRPDRSNRVSGQAAAIDLGRRLFFDARLSPSGRFSCSSCHRPERGWSDGRPLGIGLVRGRRNTPSLFNVRLGRWFGWGGAGDSLWAQSLRPLLDAREMGSSARHVQAYLAADRELASAYSAVFGRGAEGTDAEAVLVDAAKALAAYQETIVSGRTGFDAFRDALSAGDGQAAGRYPAAARRGLGVFIGKGGCSACHAGAAFTDGAFHDIRSPAARKGDDRRDGIARLLASPFNLAGRFSDDVERRVTWTAEELTSGSADNAGFKTPSLRNLARTAPYLHDGSAATLDDAIRAHAEHGRPLVETEVADLVTFLETLNEVVAPGAR